MILNLSPETYKFQLITKLLGDNYTQKSIKIVLITYNEERYNNYYRQIAIRFYAKSYLIT